MNIKTNYEEREYIFKPLTTEKEITQNIENILSRSKYNIPLAREKGVLAENIDKPQEIIKATIVADISEEIDREEPRLLLSEIMIENSIVEFGKIKVNVKGEINE